MSNPVSSQVSDPNPCLVDLDPQPSYKVPKIKKIKLRYPVKLIYYRSGGAKRGHHCLKEHGSERLDAL